MAYLNRRLHAKIDVCGAECSMPLLEWISRLRAGQPRVLFVDDAPPSPLAGAGQPRAALLVDALLKSGARVILLPRFGTSDFTKTGKRHPNFQVMRPTSEQDFDKILTSRLNKVSQIIVSRPNNMERCCKILSLRDLNKVRLIYDAEAIFAKREQMRRTITGADLNPNFEGELALARHADTILSVSALEAEAFRAAGHADVRVLSYASPYLPTETCFSERDGFLFVGPVYDPTTPNADSLMFFTEQVFPRIRAVLPNARLLIAGQPHATIPARTCGVSKLGLVTELAEIYSECRVFIAPTRFAAGIPLKAIDAAASGLPIVMTSVLAQQLGWKDGKEALVADEAESFAQACITLHSDEALWVASRQAALSRVRSDFDKARFETTVEGLMRSLAQ